MYRKFQVIFALVLILSTLMSACAPATEPAQEVLVAEPTTAEVVVPTETLPTAVPPTETPLPEPDIAALFNALTTTLAAEKNFGQVPGADLLREMAEPEPPYLLDVRESTEIEADGFIDGAVNIPVRQVLRNLDKLPSVDEKIVVYCGSGHRGAFILSALRLLGYTDVRNLAGGLGAWKKAELPVVTGSLPAEPQVLSTPIIADEALYNILDGFLSVLPDGFHMLKADKISEALQSSNPPALVDVRSAAEVEKDGYIDGSVNIPWDQVFSNLDKLSAKDQPTIIYCGSGYRGAIVAAGLRMLGYDVTNLGGGLNAWKAASLPVAGVVNWPAVWGEFLKGMPDNFYSVKADSLLVELSSDQPPFLLDVRDPAELTNDGYIKGAVNIPIRNLLKNLDKLPAQGQRIVIYCGSGHRGGMAMAALRLLGYTDVVNLGGGLGGWKKANLPFETDSMSAEPVAGTAPAVDSIRLRDMDAWLSVLPDGFLNIKPVDLQTELSSATPPVVVDLRTESEIAETGFIASSLFIETRTVYDNLGQLPADKTAAIVTSCQSGHRGGIVMMALSMSGYTNVRSLFKGINGWVAESLPLEK